MSACGSRPACTSVGTPAGEPMVPARTACRARIWPPMMAVCCALAAPTLTAPPAAMLHWRISRSTSTFWPALMMAFSMKRAFSSPPQTMCAVRAGPDASCIASAMPMMPPLTVTLPPASTSAASMVPLTTTSPVTRTSMVALMSPRTCSEPSKLMLPVVRSTASTSTTGLTCTPWLISLGCRRSPRAAAAGRPDRSRRRTCRWRIACRPSRRAARAGPARRGHRCRAAGNAAHERRARRDQQQAAQVAVVHLCQFVDFLGARLEPVQQAFEAGGGAARGRGALRHQQGAGATLFDGLGQFRFQQAVDDALVGQRLAHRLQRDGTAALGGSRVIMAAMRSALSSSS